MSQQSTGRLPRVLSYIVGICGILMLALGITVYAITSSQLVAQRVTVADYDEGASGVPNGQAAGQLMADPFTALAQINAITHHMQQASQMATGGTKDAATGTVTGGDPEVTYGNAPSITLDGQGNCTSAVSTWTDPQGLGTVQCDQGGPLQVTGSIDAHSITTLRGTLTTGSFLIASLFVSVIAFGVSLLIAGLGLLFLLVGIIALNLTNKSYGKAVDSKTAN